MIPAQPNPEALTAGASGPSVRRDPVWLDAALLVAVAVVVCLVSLPRLRGFAVHGNERDARMVMGILRTQLEAETAAPLEPGMAGLLESSPELSHRMRDVRDTQVPGVLVHHGYCFHFDGQRVLAWPQDYGRTGRLAFRLISGSEVQAHRNGGAWDGPATESSSFEHPAWAPVKSLH